MSDEASGELPKIGSKVLLSGRFSFYREATNPGEYDAAAYYQGLGVGGSLQESKVLWQSEDYAPFRQGLYRLREYFGNRLDHVFPPKEAGILKALLLGEKSEVDPELKQLYQDGGIVHILSISGLHVSLLGMGLFELLRRLGMRQSHAAAVSGMLLVFYGIMTGLSVSACRAIGMFLLRMLAAVCGRTYDLTTALAVLAAGMLCTQPLYALQSGFWLSFGAMAGVGAVLPVIRMTHEGKPGNLKPGEGRFGKGIRAFLKWTGEGFQAGMAVFLATLPLMLLFYYEIPVYSSLVNLLVLPLMGALVGMGFVVMLVPGTGPLGFVILLFLKWFELLCGIVRELPFHAWNPGCPKAWRILAYYLLFVSVLIGLWIKKSRKRCLLFLPMLFFCLPHLSRTEVTLLDVGQGDCACIRTAGGEVLISDCGSTSRDQVGKYVLLPFLKYKGIHEIDAIFLSHGDRDHISGIEELLRYAKQEGIHVRKLFLPELGEQRMREEFSGILQAAGNVGGLEVERIGGGVQMQLAKDSVIRVLHPSIGQVEELDGNEASLCLWMDLCQGGETLSLLFTGDVCGRGEEDLIANLRALSLSQVTILKCAHHGSKYATSEAFLKALDAELSVISCGRNNIYGHPGEETLRRMSEDGSMILRTDRGGAVTILMRGRNCHIYRGARDG